MKWTTPKFEEITLGMEVTGYVNTDPPAPTTTTAATDPDAAEAPPRPDA